MSVYHERDVVDPEGVAIDRTTTATRWTFGPGQLIGGAVGLVACIFGVLAITRAGIDGTLNRPTVSIMDFTQSAAVGIAELVAGLLILAGAASVRNRALMGFVGGLMFVGGLIVAASSATLLGDLGTDRRTGWLVLAGGVIAIVASALPLITTSRRDTRLR